MAFSPASAGVIYRCPLCSQCFGGRPRLDPDLAVTPQRLTASVAKSDPRIIEHLQKHSPAEWLLKVDALEREVELLRAASNGRRRILRGLTSAEAGNDA